jgi:Na+/H+ antiporter NhaC
MKTTTKKICLATGIGVVVGSLIGAYMGIESSETTTIHAIFNAYYNPFSSEGTKTALGMLTGGLVGYISGKLQTIYTKK